jgi:lactate dehydrogenase-like 2-hydroxyacid dehydrogenase
VKPRIIAMLPLYAPAMAALEQEYELLKPWEATDPAAFLREQGHTARAVVSSTSRGFGAAEFAAFPKMETLACFGPYVTIFGLDRARELGITVSNTPDETAEPVADLALGLLISVMRRLNEADRFVRAGRWPTQAFPSGREVHGARCGIVGFGRIGQQLAKRLTGLDMQIRYHGPRAKADVPFPYVADLKALAAWCDCLVITCALTPQTCGMVDASVLEALGSDSYLVNIARGAIVDEAALIAALQQGVIAGAGLDVFADEPRVPAALLGLDNVALSPHIGTSTQENRDERTRKLLANLRAHFAGKPLPYEATSHA